MKDKLIKIDRNGTKYYANYTCQRCGGLGGSDKWQFTGWTCYDCGGSGIAPKPDIYKVYTPEYEAKLNERRQKRAAKKLAELEAKNEQTLKEWLANNQFDEDGNTYVFLGNTYALKDDIKALGAKFDTTLGWHINKPVSGYKTLKINISDIATKTLYGYSVDHVKVHEIVTEATKEDTKESNHVGKVGDKVAEEVTLNNMASWKSSFRAWENNYTFLYNFVDADGNVLVWKTSKCLNINNGDKVNIKGTIKEHSEYKGTKQTVLTRCAIE